MAKTIKDEALKLRKNIDDVYQAGQKSEYDRFWDNYQDNGNRTDYSNAFAGDGWIAETFKPKHNIIPTNAYMIFRTNLMEIDLVEYLENLGVTLDISQATNTQYIFTNAMFTRVGVIDVRGSTIPRPLDNTFAYCKRLKTIEKVILKTGSNGEFNAAFTQCIALENVTFEGEITKDIDIKFSPLTVASAKSIITALKDYSGTDKEYTYSVSFSASTLALLEAEGATAPNGGTWISYIGSKCWNT